MTYMEEGDQTLARLLAGPFHRAQAAVEEYEKATATIKRMLLDSYRNGQRACPTCSPRPSRRPAPRRRLYADAHPHHDG
jgi:hypothetical protein